MEDEPGEPDFGELARAWHAANCPIAAARATLTIQQAAAYEDPSHIVVVDGGNRAGKTRTACIAVAAMATGQHARSTGPVHIWYATTTYELFSQGAWPHLQRLLWYPGEDVYHPGRYVQRVDWLRPGIPKSILLRNGSTITIKSFEQGPGEFQAAQIDMAVLDEEAPESIWLEIQARFLACASPYILIPATPILGVQWIEDLRRHAQEGRGGVGHHRLRTMDNPAMGAEMIQEMSLRYKDQPEQLRLRLEGIPFALHGLVYPDGLFKAEHVVDPYQLGGMTLYRCIDHGYRNCACLWVAVSKGSDDWIVYRDYLGKELKLADNAKVIERLSEGENYARTYIDPATMGTDAETGLRVIDLWRRQGLDCAPAPDNRVDAGIERCKLLLGEMGGPEGKRPRFRVFRTCQEFLRERRSYSWPKPKDEGDDKKEKPVKTGDHVMDAWRYLVSADLQWIRVEDPMPAEGTIAYEFWKQLHPAPAETL